MPANPIQILTNARDRIVNPLHWTQNTMARDDEGRDCPETDQFACQWCAVGTMEKTFSKLKPHQSHRYNAYELLRRRMEGDIPLFNDTHSHAEVLMAFQGAIRDAEIN